VKIPEEKMRAALYIRVSTEEQARHGLSLGDQRAALESYAKSHNMTVVGVYEDAGISARKPYKKRPALLRLLDDVEAKKIDIILFIKLDRWFRNVGNYYAVQEILERNKVVWQATNEDYETQTAAGRLKVNIMLSVAQDEADRTSERIKFVFDGKRARGEALTGDKPFGYIIEGKKYIKDPQTETAVNELFAKYAACGSISQTQDLIAEKYGIFLSYQAISKIIRSTAYYGKYFRADGMCPPYITKERYDKNQTLRKTIVRKCQQNRIYLFTGLMICGDCGGHISGRINQDQKNVSYNCQNHYCRRRPCGNAKSISEKKIEAFLMNSVENKLKSYKSNLMGMEESEEKENYQALIASKKARLSRLKDLYLNELISLEEFKKDHAEICAAIAAMEEKQNAKKTPKLDKVEKILSGDWRNIYAELSREEKREFWRVIVKEIRWFPDRHLEFDINT